VEPGIKTMKDVFAPWTDEQVQNLKEFQEFEPMHPFTCVCREKLIPTKDGWICSKCDYTQNYAYDFMVDGSCIENFKKMMKGIFPKEDK